MKRMIFHRIDLALPIGMTLILSTVTILLFPGIAAVACELFAGLVLVLIFAARKAIRFARERQVSRVSEVPGTTRILDRGDVLWLLGFAGLYAGGSGFLLRAGWPDEAVRSCALCLLVISLLVKPRITARWKTQSRNRELTEKASKVSAIPPLDPTYPEIAGNERIQ